MSSNCYTFRNGAKLMEHSYVGNVFVASAIRMIRGNKTYPFVWCGNYADPVEGQRMNMYEFATQNDNDVKWVEKHCEDLINIECMGFGDYKEVAEFTSKYMDRYVVNHTKKQYVEVPELKEGELTIHPLPLLTADGNGKGRGDYWLECPDSDLVGLWAYDVIESTDEKPDQYTELKVNFERH